MPDKLRERFYLEQLRKVINLPSSPINESERPDFLLVSGCHRLGIELTDFYLPAPCGQRLHQEQQSLKDQIVERAERLHAEAGGPALYVAVNFHHSSTLRKQDIQPYAEALADSVLHSSIPPSVKGVQIPWGHRPRFTSGILLQKSVNGRDKDWSAEAGGMVASITPEHVSACVKVKTEKHNDGKAPHPLSRCDELWLVIVQDYLLRRPAPADFTDEACEAFEAVYEGPFHRLIWLISHSPRAYDLQCRFLGPR
jgi:hypothetical protein